MNEYVVLATQEMNIDDPESEVTGWAVGTLEQAKYWTEKWERDGYQVHVRKCTHPINKEFVKAALNHRGEPA